MEQTQQNAMTGTLLGVTTWDAYRVLRLAVLAVGPFVTLAFVPRVGTGIEVASIETVLMLLWSPLFFSIPALILQNERDRALPAERNAFVRGVKLLPHLLSVRSAIRAEMMVSIATWSVLTFLTLDSVSTVVGRVLAGLLG
jgi:hypothetical protein